MHHDNPSASVLTEQYWVFLTLLLFILLCKSYHFLLPLLLKHIVLIGVFGLHHDSHDPVTKTFALQKMWNLCKNRLNLGCLWFHKLLMPHKYTCIFLNIHVYFLGCAVASWLVRLTPDRAVGVRALAGDVVLCSWARHLTLTVPLSTQGYKCCLI